MSRAVPQPLTNGRSRGRILHLDLLGASRGDGSRQQAAEEALWAWYLEWGGIARLVVSDRRALRAMGFLSRRRAGGDEAEEDLDEAGDSDGATDDDTLVSGSPPTSPEARPPSPSESSPFPKPGSPGFGVHDSTAKVVLF